jgi:hypothetical protein
MNLRYETSRQISADEFIDLLKRSTLAERRPVDDRKCIQAMLQHAGLLCTAWDGESLLVLHVPSPTLSIAAIFQTLPLMKNIKKW